MQNSKKILMAICASILFLFSCADKNIMEDIDHLEGERNQNVVVPEAYLSDSEREVKTISGSSYTMSYEEVDGINIMEGDIMLTDRQIRVLKDNANNPDRGAIQASIARRWCNNIVPFEIVNVSNVQRVINAMDSIEAHTDIQFVQRTTETDYVRYVNGDGCASFVGKIGGAQDVILGSCSFGTTLHEILHALGVFHEQSRTDRNSFVTVNTANIKSTFENNFTINGITTGAFNFNSLMMYGPCFFAVACGSADDCSCTAAQATITTAAGGLYNIQRLKLDEGDIATVNFMYPTLEIQGAGAICTSSSSTFTLNIPCSSASWTASSNLTVTSSSSSSIRVQANGTGAAYVEATLGTRVIRKDFFIGKPTFTIELDSPSNYVFFDAVGTGTDINDQGITTVVWEKLSGNGIFNAYQNGFHGFGHGSGYNWTVEAKVTMTNDCGTTIKYFTVTPNVPTDPCKTGKFVLKKEKGTYVANRPEEPCRYGKTAVGELSRISDAEINKAVLYNKAGRIVKTYHTNNFTTDGLQGGIFTLKLTFEGEEIERKIFVE